MFKRFLLLNGPNLDMLGIREPEVYGSTTLEALEEMVLVYAAERGIVLSTFQSNSESELVEKIHYAHGRYDGIVFNPGAYTHYSYALRDAVGAIDAPVVEVHISDVDNREPFRSVSVVAPACIAQVKGLGIDGYCRAIDILDGQGELTRLGEGYENRFPAGSNIIIASNASLPAGARSALGAGVSADQLFSKSAGHQPVGDTRAATSIVSGDFAIPLAQNVTAPDAGPVSLERQNLVRTICVQMGIDALFVRDTSNIRWITAFDGVFDEEQAHALVITPSWAALHTDSRYVNAVLNAAQNASSNVFVNDDRTSHAQFAKSALVPDNAAFFGRLGIEDTITYAEFAKTVETFGAQGLIATTDLVRGLRAVKSGAELNRMRAAQAVTDAAFAHIVGFMKPGMTEREVQLELDQFMLRHGAEGLAFSSIVATGANGADPHAIPGNTRLEAGQCVVMDFGAKVCGYCSDMTRTVFLGQPHAKMAHAWETLRRANETVEASLRPGITGKAAHELAEQVLAEGGFGGAMGHGLGHGVGLDIHELPVLNARNDLPLAIGNVVTVEPGIYLRGEFGMRLEDCGVITQDGYEVFSKLGHEMVVL